VGANLTASGEIRDDERQQDESPGERHDDCEHHARDDCGRCSAFALVGDLAQMRGLLRSRMDRMAAEALAVRVPAG
jgi:hypothetical protein